MPAAKAAPEAAASKEGGVGLEAAAVKKAAVEGPFREETEAGQEEPGEKAAPEEKAGGFPAPTAAPGAQWAMAETAVAAMVSAPVSWSGDTWLRQCGRVRWLAT